MKNQEQKKQTTKTQQKRSDQKDAGIAAENRPRPSQAEGDEETIDQDVARKGNRQ
jgi:hypothetical protein